MNIFKKVLLLLILIFTFFWGIIYSAENVNIAVHLEKIKGYKTNIWDLWNLVIALFNSQGKIKKEYLEIKDPMVCNGTDSWLQYNNGIWECYSKVIADITAPTGWTFNINNNAATTSNINISLNIICASDTSNPIQVAFWNTSNPINWQTCASTKSHTLTSWNGNKIVYMRFKDSVWNMSSQLSDTINLSIPQSTGNTFADIPNKSTVLQNLDSTLWGSNYVLCATTFSEATVSSNCGNTDLIYLASGWGYDYGIYYKYLPTTFATDSWLYNAKWFLFSSNWPNNRLSDSGSPQNLSYIQNNIATYRWRAIWWWYVNSHLWCTNGRWSNSYDLIGRPCNSWNHNSAPSWVSISVYAKKTNTSWSSATSGSVSYVTAMTKLTSETLNNGYDKTFTLSTSHIYANMGVNYSESSSWNQWAYGWTGWKNGDKARVTVDNNYVRIYRNGSIISTKPRSSFSKPTLWFFCYDGSQTSTIRWSY